MEDVHVMPTTDIQPHEESPKCWCNPAYEHGRWDDADLYIHNGPEDRAKG